MEDLLSLNRFDPARIDQADGQVRALLERRARTAGSASVLFYDTPIEVVAARGAWMLGSDGTRYLDMYNNVPSVGHCHPRVVAAMTRQAGRLNINTRYLNEATEAYAERLLGLLPDPVARLILTCSGSESNDLALRLASTWTRARGFVVTRFAYHGNSSLVTGISPSSMPRGGLGDAVRTIAIPDTTVGDAGQVGARMAADLDRAIAELKTAGHGFAGFVADSIFASDGVHPDPAGFLRPVVEAAHAAGGLFIADEVQGGFARTGRHFWSFDRHGVAPDIVTMGKPMGNGYPMGGMAARADILDAFSGTVSYFNTFGGNPVAAAVGAAVLDVIEDEGLLANADRIGAMMLARLREIAAAHDVVGAVRGAGLFLGVDIVERDDGTTPDTLTARTLVNLLRDMGILVSAAGAGGNSLKIRPPLCIDERDAQIFLEAFDRALREHGDRALAVGQRA